MKAKCQKQWQSNTKSEIEKMHQQSLKYPYDTKSHGVSGKNKGLHDGMKFTGIFVLKLSHFKIYT